MDKPKVGDKFWVVDCGNAVRGGAGSNREGIVTVVGRKFFTVNFPFNDEPDCNYRVDCIFHLKDYLEKSGYSATKILYASRREYQYKLDAETGYGQIRKFFDHYGQSRLTLLQITEILKILDIQEET